MRQSPHWRNDATTLIELARASVNHRKIDRHHLQATTEFAHDILASGRDRVVDAAIAHAPSTNVAQAIRRAAETASERPLGSPHGKEIRPDLFVISLLLEFPSATPATQVDMALAPVMHTIDLARSLAKLSPGSREYHTPYACLRPDSVIQSPAFRRAPRSDRTCGRISGPPAPVYRRRPATDEVVAFASLYRWPTAHHHHGTFAAPSTVFVCRSMRLDRASSAQRARRFMRRRRFLRRRLPPAALYGHVPSMSRLEVRFCPEDIGHSPPRAYMLRSRPL